VLLESNGGVLLAPKESTPPDTHNYTWGLTVWMEEMARQSWGKRGVVGGIGLRKLPGASESKGGGKEKVRRRTVGFETTENGRFGVGKREYMYPNHRSGRNDQERRVM